MQKNFSHYYNVLGYKWLQKCENSVFFRHVAEFRIRILITFAFGTGRTAVRPNINL